MSTKTSTTNGAAKGLPHPVAVFTAIAVTLALGACATNENQPTTSDNPSAGAVTGYQAPVLGGTLNGGGSSAQTAAQDAWRAGFQTANSAVTVNYDPVGSGAGRTSFAAGSYSFIGTDDAFTTADLASTTFALCTTGSNIVEVPAYISPIAIAFNLPGIASLDFDATTAAKLLTGAIKQWDDAAIAALNPGVTLPPTAVTPVHRSDKSGTTGNVTDYLSQTAPAIWVYGRTETWPNSLGGEAAEKTQGVAQAISGAAGAVGYIDASQAGGLGVAHLINAGSPVAPTAAAATKALAASGLQSGRTAGDLVYDVARMPADTTAYPMIMVSYLVACGQYNDAATGALVKAYLAYSVSDAGQQAAAANAGSAPLTVDAGLSSKVKSAIDSIR